MKNLWILYLIGIVFVAGCVDYGVPTTTTTEEPAAVFGIAVTSAPSSALAGDSVGISWQVSSDQTRTIAHTAIHYDTSSNPGDLSLEVSPGQAGYLSLTPDYASGEFEIPNTFTAQIDAPQEAGILYFRAHTIIDGDNYWTDEKSITVTAATTTTVPETTTTTTVKTTTTTVRTGGSSGY